MKTIAGILMCLFLATNAYAHRSSDSYIQIHQQKNQVSVSVEVNLRDLSLIHDLDSNADNAITWSELQHQDASLSQWLKAGVQFTADGQTCPTQLQPAQVSLHQDEYYLYYTLSAQCANDDIALDYQLLFDVNPEHKALVSWQEGATQSSFVISAQKHQLRIRSQSLAAQFFSFVHEGIGHILSGTDHLLFLLCLLLPAALQRENNRWQARTDTRHIIIDIIKIISAFTLAHSITLALATFDVVRLPTRLTESVIAVSIIIAALNVLWPFMQRRLIAVTFAFGLVHGFGFATVLAELGLPQGQKLISLLAFNLGVEAGQLMVVALILPLLLLLRHRHWYIKTALPLGACAATVMAAIWLGERAFGLS